MKLKTIFVALTLLCVAMPALALPPPIAEERVLRLMKRETRAGNEEAASQWRAVLRKIRGKKIGAITLEEVRKIVDSKTGKERRLWVRAREAVKQAMLADVFSDGALMLGQACIQQVNCQSDSEMRVHFADGDWRVRVPKWKEVPSGMGHYGAWMETGSDGSLAGVPQVWADLPPGAEPFTMASPTVSATFTGQAKGVAARGHSLKAQISKKPPRVGEFTADMVLKWHSDSGQLDGLMENFQGTVTEPDWKVILGGIANAQGTGTVARTYIDLGDRGGSAVSGQWTATPYGNVTVPSGTVLPGTTEPEGFVGTFNVNAFASRDRLQMAGAYDATRLGD